jgi:hypothetical protein
MRNSTDIKGIHRSKSMGGAEKSSMPKSNSSSNYLNLYLLEKEMERLLKELEGIEIRRDKIQHRLDVINKKMKKDSKTKEKPKVILKENEKIKKEWKTMDLSY